MTQKLRLYVWENALVDWTAGVMFALAESPEQARDLILADCHYIPDDDIAREPTVYDAPFGMAVWGGG